MPIIKIGQNKFDKILIYLTKQVNTVIIPDLHILTYLFFHLLESSSLTELVTEQPDQKRNNGIKSKETTSTIRNTRKY